MAPWMQHASCCLRLYAGAKAWDIAQRETESDELVGLLETETKALFPKSFASSTALHHFQNHLRDCLESHEHALTPAELCARLLMEVKRYMQRMAQRGHSQIQRHFQKGPEQDAALQSLINKAHGTKLID